MKKAQYIFCVSCETKSENFVAILRNDHALTMNKHWYVCLRCYEGDKWQTVTKTKELTTKSGLSKSSTKSKRRSKQSASPSVAAWEESIQATSTSTLTEKNWWEK